MTMRGFGIPSANGTVTPGRADTFIEGLTHEQLTDVAIVNNVAQATADNMVRDFLMHGGEVRELVGFAIAEGINYGLALAQSMPEWAIQHRRERDAAERQHTGQTRSTSESVAELVLELMRARARRQEREERPS